MQTVTTIGLDIAKSVFQVHGHDGAGEVVIRRQLKRRSVLAFFQKLPPCAWSALRPAAPTAVALSCRWRSRPKHQTRKSRSFDHLVATGEHWLRRAIDLDQQSDFSRENTPLLL